MSEPSDAGSVTLPAGYPADLERFWRAADGTRVFLRPLRPDDIEREIAFIEGLSENTLYLRVQYSARQVRRDEAARLLDLDYRDQLAIGALVDGDAGQKIIGVSRYARIEDTDRADCAIVVDDAWQGRGIGTELVRSLVIGARTAGIRTLEGSTLAQNQPIHAWARRFGVAMQTEPNSGGQVRVTLDVQSFVP